MYLRLSSKKVMNNRGTSIIFAVFALIVLSILGLTIFSLVSTDLSSSTSQILSSRALFAAEAGWQIGAQAVRDDKNADPQTADKAANGYYGISYLDGYSSDGVTDNENACLHGTDWNDDTELFCTFDTKGQFVDVWNFQQRFNFIGARAANVARAVALEIIIRARKRGNGDQKIKLFYSTDGGSEGGSWRKLKDVKVREGPDDWEYLTQSIKIDKDDVWQVLMSTNGNDFRIRAQADKTGSRECDIDWFALRVTTEVDASSEPWASNSYISLPAALGNGSIESITVSDESGKININYAPYNLLRRLLRYCGITPQGTANTLATNIVNYRTSDWFSTIQEVKQVDGVTDAYFDLIKDDITVCSWVNQDVTRPTGARAPVNINTASENVLKAIIRLCDPGSPADDRAQQLVEAIRDQIEDSPFTSMYSSYETQLAIRDETPPATRDLTSFSGFIRDLCDDVGFDWLSEDSYTDALRILNIADGSSLNRDVTQNWADNDVAGGVEFCYYSHTFLIESTGENGNIERTVVQTYGDIYNYSTYTFDSEGELALPTYIGESGPRPYWREEH